MARLPRLTLAGHLHHVIQRGNNRQPIFVDVQDQEAMLALLVDQSRRWQVAVHAYVLMPNHFHLLLTPGGDDGVARMLQAVGRSYVQAFNRRHGRSGTLWEGRYRSTVMQAERWMLPAMVYVDLNPVRAGLVAQALDYPWSSCAHWLGQRTERWLTAPPEYWALGNTPFAREQAYAALVHEGLAMADVARISEGALKGWALGEEAFLAQVQASTSRRLAPERPGRPLKIEKSEEK